MADSAILTFLFTDIEGSTRMWDQSAAAMREALAKHDALMRERLGKGGQIFKTMGDSFCATFQSPSEALSAALALQRELKDMALADGTPVTVRMALHTGEAEARDGDYFGPSLNRVSRLLSAGHGGQVLVSQTTYELVRDTLPASAELVHLGDHRLRDLERPESVYQLSHPELRSSFPPLRSLSEMPNNLPAQVTTFVGREKELADVEALIKKNRLVTLTGSGGTGKTRLSLHVGASALSEFPDGVWLVELAPLSEPELVPQVVAAALDVREEPGRAMLDRLVAHLKEKKLLIILDNCEHLLDAAAQLVNALLQGCPNVRILTSSREPLNVMGEQVYRLPSLSTPDPKKKQTAESLEHFDAVRLFVDRAMLAQPNFQISDKNADAVAQLCHRLDGIPLAIELAAARVRSMPVETIASRLDDRFRLLTGGSRTALPRQQTLRATIDWSYDLLDEKEKTLLRRLSVFSGGWTLEAAEAVCADPD